MKRISTSVATAILLACSVAITAQTSSTNRPSSPAPTQGSATQSGSTTRDSSTPAPQRRATRSARSTTANPPQEVTLTGCLQSGDQSGTSASTATNAGSATRRAQANAAPTFILSSASAGSSPSSSEPRSVGTTGNESTTSSSASLSGAAGSYMLQGLDLSRQVGQQVEITGTVMPASSGRNARSRATGTAGSSADASSSPQRIRVISARMVSEHCSNQ